MSSRPPFTFFSDRQELPLSGVFVVDLPAGLATRVALFDAYQQQLRLPSYFGRNWDALLDCLGDLSWIEPEQVVIVHEDLPHLELDPIRQYLGVLTDSVLSWKPHEAHRLRVAFPANVRREIESIMKDGQ